MKVKFLKRLLFVITVALLGSCSSTEETVYFQNAQPNHKFDYAQGGFIKVKQGDKVSIIVSSSTPELAAVFNLFEQRQGSTTASNMERYAYTIDSNGNIDFPILGELYICGMTKEEIALYIKQKLIADKLVEDPVVTVNFENLQFFVMGDVAKPGGYNITKDRFTVLEALSTAGDLNITGVRDRILVTRDEGGQKVSYQVNLKDQSVYNSPAYYIQQNDLIYVEPNNVKANESTINGNTVRSTSFWMSLTSLLTTLTLVFIK